MKKLILIALALFVVLAGCGSKDAAVEGSPADQAAAKPADGSAPAAVPATTTPTPGGDASSASGLKDTPPNTPGDRS